MSSVSKLKDKARDFERKEDWNRAVDAYLQVLQATEKEASEAELSLYNRVGDLYLRLGRPSDAVDYYSKAADHYGEAGLYNNAIALCNKALRYQPDRLELYRKLGKLSAEQGFITDARRWYLEYAEKLARSGDKQKAFDALKEFATLSEDPEIREMLAVQLETRGETGETVVQLRLAYTQYRQQGVKAKVDELAKRIVALDPRLDATDLTLTIDGAGGGRSTDLPGMYIDPAAPGAAAVAGAAAPAALAPAAPAPAASGGTIGVDEGFGFDGGAPAAEVEEATPLAGLDEAPTADSAALDAGELPGLMATDMGAEATEAALADGLPTLDVDQGAARADAEDGSSADFDLPTLEEAETFGAEAEAEPLPGLDAFEDMGGEEAEPAGDLGGDLPMLAGELIGDDLPMLAGELIGGDQAVDAGELPSLDIGLEDSSIDATALPALDVGLEEDSLDATELPVLDVGLEAPAAADAPLENDTWGDFEPADEGTAVPIPTLADETDLDVDVEPEEPADEEPVDEEPAPAAAVAYESVEELDVEALIRSARARFESGERREALISLEAQHANLADASRLSDAYHVAEAITRMDPDAVSAHQARVEYAFRLDDRARLVDAYIDFASCLKRTGAAAKADSVLQRVLEIDPQNAAARAALARPAVPAMPAAVAPESNFIDLGGLLKDDDEETTRFVVAETVESGDEERDFADMLSQFRAKIAQHVPQEDTESHYDLGIAFKEMGLIDEAISEFQISLRGGNERLKVYEELGQCFMKKEQYNIAAKLLSRGAQLPAKDDSELLGVYYLLGRCYEELGQPAEAKEAYERVLGLDIDFRDVNERLGQL